MNSKSLKASRNGEYGTSTNVKTLGTARCSGKGNAPAGIPGEEQEGQDRSPCRVFRLRDAAGTRVPPEEAERSTVRPVLLGFADIGALRN